MRSRAILFILAFILWMLLSLPLAWHDGRPNVYQHALVGIVVAWFVSFMTGDMFVTRPHFFLHVSRYFWFAVFVPLFVWECFKANIDVAYRVAHPKVPIHPGIVKVKTKLKSETGITFLANSITLTPGTLTVDTDEEKGILYVHWINVRDKDTEAATRMIVAKFEKILSKIFE